MNLRLVSRGFVSDFEWAFQISFRAYDHLKRDLPNSPSVIKVYFIS